ncbi:MULTISPECIES: HesB/YadR/YfhF family protein [unclassified Lysinibacillus]|uniref:HesB/YadR/YfhF family protein n=1 Tax=unclassified Lysinibacillus TaxID=2636778 RepID=UPI002011FCE4|nr:MULTISPECIES: HesB/YadR/YfhF family protein [unclassified Lysinibacillus]MCL1697027.1 HesB/YadR/YfhF family protein [Lysinibacillus sp. BPa_S21]MCL1701747.1 HesB/YadR/YfhF family protein [Lysinibacillus sp. Bpr_S20]
MNITLTDKALQWFQQEMEVESGDTIRFYARYGGSSPFHEGFSLGMTREEPIQIGVKTVIDDITYYIDEKDLWFFNDHDLYVDVDASNDELKYEYKK